MPIREAIPPKGVLYRIGRSPDPLGWIPWAFATDSRFGGRFDDPEGKYRVLYAVEQRLGSFLESLAHFRKNPALLAKLGSSDPFGHVLSDWHVKRQIGTLSLPSAGSWLDLRSLETRQALRKEMAPILAGLNLDIDDEGDAITRTRSLTQAISRWTYDHGYAGIAYKSRLDHRYDCWAIFERSRGSTFAPGDVSRIADDDPDFIEALELLDLMQDR